MAEEMAEKYNSSGKKYSGERAVISLTSWRARIGTVSKTLYSLLTRCPGFHIVLVLSEEEFPKKEAELPENLMLFVKNNLIELLWVYKNYKSLKKWIFTSDKYKDVPVISADDDCIYKCNYAQELYNKWLENKDCVITNDGRERFDITWGRGPNTCYPPNIMKFDKIKICNKLLSTERFIDEDMFYACYFKQKNIKIIDLHKKQFYMFHDESEPYSKNHPIALKEDVIFLSKFILDNFDLLL